MCPFFSLFVVFQGTVFGTWENAIFGFEGSGSCFEGIGFDDERGVWDRDILFHLGNFAGSDLVSLAGVHEGEGV